MSIAILNEVYSEVRRLAVAGSLVAPGDFRIKKLIEPLKKAGAKAPIFSKVAESVEDLVNSNEQSSASSLLILSSLVCSILYTQGATGVDGKLEGIQSTSVLTQRNQISARMLKPLIEALTSTGSGRLDAIRSAIDHGLFADLRLVRPALLAIDDSYSEIGDLIAERVLPTYGKAILADLKSAYEIKGKVGHARRLKLMHTIDPVFARETVKESLVGGSPDVKVAAIECLGGDAEDFSYLIEQSKASAKNVRQAAYCALCKVANEESLAILIKGIDGKDLELVARAASDSKPPELVDAALDRARKLLVEVPSNSDKKKQGDQVGRILELISILRNPMKPESRHFLRECVEMSKELQKIKSTPGGLDIVESVVEALAADSASIDYLIQHRDHLPVECFHEIFVQGLEVLPPKKFYNTFSPYINRSAKKNTPEHRRNTIVREGLFGDNEYHWGRIRKEARKPMDVDWLNDAIAADDLELAVALAQPNHAGLVKYIDTKLTDPKAMSNLESSVASAMIVIGHPKTNAFVIEKLAASLKKKSAYESYPWCNLATRLNADALPALESLAGDAKLAESASNRLIDAISEIRERTKK
ncbi:MAG: HEAT repeat domain-containing protein [Planctomycetota bacterium]|nr:HEAT repeat domain-containing protein [Planctomycetota bacterium]